MIGAMQRQAYNSRIQGSAASLLKESMVMLDEHEEFKALGGQLLLTVHDELVAEIPRENALRGAEILVECMETPFRNRIKSVPISCDVEIAEVWAGENIKNAL